MSALQVVCCHGFAFDAQYWQVLQAYFNSHRVLCMDLDYWQQGRRVTPADVSCSNLPVVGIGHSLGFIKLLQSGIRFDYLIGLNAFTCFLGFNSVLAVKRARELSLLSQQFVHAPQKTLRSFYQRTGVAVPGVNWSAMNFTRLADDLASLVQSVDELPPTPVLILASEDDPVVPPELIWDNFRATPHISVEMLAGGRHGLGYLQAPLVHQRIMSFIHASK